MAMRSAGEGDADALYSYETAAPKREQTAPVIEFGRGEDQCVTC